MDIKRVRWLIALLMFLFIAGIGLYYLLYPAENHELLVTGEEIVEPVSLFSLGGMQMRYTAWIEFPQYNIGMGILAGTGFTGILFSGYSFLKETESYDADS